MKKITYLTAVLLFCHFAAFSQGILKGKIMDSTSAKPLGYATITVFKAADTAIITYRLSTPDGDFKVPGIPFNVECRAVISFSGYSIYRKAFTISSGEPTLDLGTITLGSEAKSLDEVLVIAERPPVVIKKDTIEFNASAFKTLPNALVEDLLKKLPGVMVDKDGNITVNGKPVNRILVDGKTFFGDDPKMATRNLPANVIDKVQVTDDKEEMLRNGDDNLNNVGKVVNITLKKGVKKGWFGKLYAGAGTSERFEGGGIANIYRDTLQLSVLGYINNLNKPGFSYNELMTTGGFDRVRSNSASNQTSSWNNASGSGVSINGVNFGGAQSFGGISTSVGGGFNLNLAPTNKKSMYFQYFNGNVRAPRESYTDIDQFFGDTIVSTHTRLTGDYVTHGHTFGTGIRLKPDSVTNLLFNASFHKGVQFEDRNSEVNTFNNKIGTLSEGLIIQNNDATATYYRQNLSLTRLSKTKKGRRYNVYHNLDYNDRNNDYVSESEVSYLYPLTFDSSYAQLRMERIPRLDINTSFNYSEPVSKHFTIRIGGRHEYSRLNNRVYTYNRSAGNDKFDILNNLLSSDFNRLSNRYIFIPALEYKWKDLTITPGVRFMKQVINNRLVSSNVTLKQNQFDILPTFSAVYKQLNFNFSRDVNLPGWNSLNPVADISNPFFISKGNPNLLPSKRNNLSVNYYFNDAKRYLNAGGYVSASFTDNDVVSQVTVDERGVQTSIPINADGSRNYSMNWNINKQYKNKQNVIFMWNTGNWMGVNKSRLIFNGSDTWQTTFNYNHWFGAGLNLNDKFEWNINYSFGKNFTRYTTPGFRELNINYHSYGNEFVLRWPKHFIWETQFSLNKNDNIPAGMPQENIQWNAALNLTMLKNEAGVLKLFVYDILNSNNNLWVSANRNVVTTMQGNILSQYFMATFSYNVRPSGAKRRVGGRERLFMF